MIRALFFACSLLLGLFGAPIAIAQSLDPDVPTPRSILGEDPGADFYLASYDDSLRYFRVLSQASDRVELERAGTTSYGLDWWYAVISAPQNVRDRERHFEISRRLARADDLSDAQARELAAEGRAVVHIDGGLHASEAACAQHTIQLAYDLAATRDDETVDRILGEVVFVLWFSINPDGQNMIADWYGQNLGTPFEVAPMPWLYQKYVGHDNNRDGYMNNMIESRVVTEQLLRYSPVVFYNHHQTAPFPARIWIPPFAEPISSNTHPVMQRWINLFGTSMAVWLDRHEMPGSVHRIVFDNWYPGFIDNVNSFRHTVSFLTETALFKYATPKFYTVSDFPRDKQGLRSEVFYSSPWKGGWWRIGDAVRYMIGSSMAVLDTASRYREELLLTRYRAARDTIERFKNEPPFAFVIPQDQRDPGTTAALIEVLMRNGLEFHRATAPFFANGREYHGGDVVLRMDQSFARLAKELLEVQAYPELRTGGSDGPIDLPYDVAGWTLPIQMGVRVDAITKPLAAGLLQTLEELDEPPRPDGGADVKAGAWTVRRAENDAVRVVNDVLRDGGEVFVLDDGDFAVRGLKGNLPRHSVDHGVTAHAIDAIPESARPLRRPRIGLYRPWSTSMDEGWTRWVLEQFGFEPTALRNEEIEAGDLGDRFDVVLFASMGARSIRSGFRKGTVPPEYAGGVTDRGMANLRSFVTDGGTMIAFDASAPFVIDLLDLKVKNAAAGKSNEELFCSGSLLRTARDEDVHDVLAGVRDEPAVMFDRSRFFETERGFKGDVLLRFPKHGPVLRSGFLRGEELMRGKAALLEADAGEGHAILFGFRPQWRGQPHGTFKLIFNAIYASVLDPRESNKDDSSVRNEAAEKFDELAAEARDALEQIVRTRAGTDEARSEAALGLAKGVLSDLEALRGKSSQSSRAALNAYLSALRTVVAQASSINLSNADATAEDLISASRIAELEAAARRALE